MRLRLPQTEPPEYKPGKGMVWTGCLCAGRQERVEGEHFSSYKVMNAPVVSAFLKS